MIIYEQATYTATTTPHHHLFTPTSTYSHSFKPTGSKEGLNVHHQ